MRCVVAGGARCGCPKPHVAQGGVLVDYVVFDRTSDVQQMACDQHPLKHKVPAFKQMCGAVKFLQRTTNPVQRATRWAQNRRLPCCESNLSRAATRAIRKATIGSCWPASVRFSLSPFSTSGFGWLMAHAMRASAVNKIVTPMILYRLNANAARATVCASAPLASMAWARFLS